MPLYVPTVGSLRAWDTLNSRGDRETGRSRRNRRRFSPHIRRWPPRPPRHCSSRAQLHSCLAPIISSGSRPCTPTRLPLPRPSCSKPSLKSSAGRMRPNPSSTALRPLRLRNLCLPSRQRSRLYRSCPAHPSSWPRPRRRSHDWSERGGSRQRSNSDSTIDCAASRNPTRNVSFPRSIYKIFFTCCDQKSEYSMMGRD